MIRTLLAVITIVLLIAGMAYAAHVHGTDQGSGTKGTTEIENLKKFQKETLSLRDDLITKRLELKNEYSKSPKDYSRIATLRKEIAEIRTKIEEIADKYGIKDLRGMGGGGVMRRGMMHDGMGHGRKGMMCDGAGQDHKGMMDGGSICPCPMDR